MSSIHAHNHGPMVQFLQALKTAIVWALIVGGTVAYLIRFTTVLYLDKSQVLAPLGHLLGR